MARRADPQRIHQARRSAVRNGLTDVGVDLEDAERWCDAWEAEAARQALERGQAYWTAGEEWIAAERAAGIRKPPRPAGEESPAGRGG